LFVSLACLRVSLTELDRGRVMDKNEFSEGMALLLSSIGKEMPAEQLAAWYVQLKELSPGQLKRGIVETLRTHQFAGWPPVGTVFANARAGGVSMKDAPLAAWSAVHDAIRRVGAYDSPDFADQVVNAAIRSLGGWVSVCNTPTNKMHWLEGRFCKTYAALQGASLSMDETQRLPGICEVDNARIGHNAPIRVAHVRCLTVDNGQEEPVQISLAGVEQEPKRLESNAATDALIASTTIDVDGDDRKQNGERR